MDESPLSFTGYKTNMMSLAVKGLENVVGVHALARVKK
jgi:hypothetical protein